MFLSDTEITQALNDGRLRVSGEPVIQPASVELHLGRMFRQYDRSPYPEIDPLEEHGMIASYLRDDETFRLGSLSFALAHTVEEVGVDATLAAQVDGKSSLARLGLQVHMTSGFIDPGFHGQITLELFNATPKTIVLRPGMLIAQMFIVQISGVVARPYGSPGIDSKYQGQQGPTQARLSGREYVSLTSMNLTEPTFTASPGKADGWGGTVREELFPALKELGAGDMKVALHTNPLMAVLSPVCGVCDERHEVDPLAKEF